MKLPEPLFAIINPLMRLLLHSPLHGILSGGLMLITFTGRKSGRQFTTPVRYIKTDGTIRCFTAAENQWWRNLRTPAEVKLHIQGQTNRYMARAIADDSEEIRKWLVFYLGLYPQDAAYHDIRLNKDKSLQADDLERAIKNAIVVEATAL